MLELAEEMETRPIGEKAGCPNRQKPNYECNRPTEEIGANQHGQEKNHQSLRCNSGK